MSGSFQIISLQFFYILIYVLCNTIQIYVDILYLKSLRSVQISILEPKNYPRSSKNWSVLWKKFGHVGHQIVFQCEIWCGSVAKFVTLSVIDDLRIISVINRVASKNNLTTKPVQYVLRFFCFTNFTNLENCV